MTAPSPPPPHGPLESGPPASAPASARPGALRNLLRLGLGLRLLFVFFVLNGLAAYFVFSIFRAEIKPSAREVMEDALVDSAHVLAELAAQDFPPHSPDAATWQALAQTAGHVEEHAGEHAAAHVARQTAEPATDSLSHGLPAAQAPSPQDIAHALQNGRFAQGLRAYAQRDVQASIWGVHKTSLDYRVYVTDARGIVLYDSQNQAQGADFSRWRDVYLTLRGQYGARSSQQVQGDPDSTVMHVAAPIVQEGRIVGVLTVAKPNQTVQAFIARAERRILHSGLWLLALSAAIGLLVTLWIVRHVRRLRRYANSVQAHDSLGKVPLPRMPGELGELAAAMHAMRTRLQGQEYISHYVRTVTHELKSPIAAIRGAAELLEDDLPAADRQHFAHQIGQQATRMGDLIDQLLQLSRLEQQQALHQRQHIPLPQCAAQAMAAMQPLAATRQITLLHQLHPPNPHTAPPAPPAPTLTPAVQADLVVLACTSLLANAIDFSPAHSCIHITSSTGQIRVRDAGVGVPDYALARLGERFFSTPRPDGRRSGSGLGLAIVQQIMALHGGQLHFIRHQPGLEVVLDFDPTPSTAHPRA